MDMPLDETGRAQAGCLGAWLREREVTSIFCSPLVRAAESASIAAREYGILRVQAHDLFRELDTGVFTGLTMEEARLRYPEAYATFHARSWDSVPGAESSRSLRERALSAWTLLSSAEPSGGDATVCVTHGGFLQWMVRTVFDADTWMPLVPTDNCAVFELFVMPTGMDGFPFMQWKHFNYRVPCAGDRAEPVF